MNCTVILLGIIKDLATIIGVGIASFVGISGLSAWKKQLKGKTDYELARRYLKSVYKVRDALKYVRNPFMSVDEISIALKEGGFKEKDYSDHKKSNRAVYSSRWNKVVEATSELNLESLEAQVSWGQPAIDVQKDFMACVRKLHVSLKMFLEGYSTEKQNDLIYDSGEDNILTKAISVSIEKIENYLKPHLK